MSEAPQDVKPTEAGPTTMSIKVTSSDGNEVFFKIKPSTKFGKLKNAYADRVGKGVDTIRFVNDGERIQDDDTPDSLGLEDGDSVDVILEQVGGSRP